MELGTLLVAGVVVAVGLAGTVVPLVPGLPLIWLAAVGSWWVTGWRGAATLTLVLLTLLMIAGTAAKYWLPARSARATGAPTRSLVLGAILGVVGALLIPVVGFPLGLVAGLLLEERRRLDDPGAAWASTRATLRAYGAGVLIELGAGLAMAAIWLVIALTA